MVKMSRINQTETALPRNGTKCQFCGLPITNRDFITCDGGAKGSIIYAHRGCCDIGHYSLCKPDTYRKPTYSGFQWGCEFETNDYLTEQQRLFLWANYKLYSTRDGTVTEELKSLRNQGLHGVKTYLQGIYKVVDIKSGDTVGTHATVSLAHWNSRTATNIQRYGYNLFKDLAYWLNSNITECEELFGRYFDDDFYQYTDDDFVKYYWLRIRQNGSLEFRIAKFQSVEQYSKMLCLLKEFCLIIERDFLSNCCQQSARKASQNIMKALIKHVDKKANYFRPERNK